MNKRYEPTIIKDLGSIQDLTQGNLNGAQQDGIQVTLNTQFGQVTVFGTVSGIPVP